VTQVARAGEADVFHTRLAHTLKVAQVGRRIAEYVLREQPEVATQVGVDVEVVEAACLAHDLGHPPFGHRGEEVLRDCVTTFGEPEGYEGNAQSLRILTKLAVRFEACDGLDLTRATLAACIKYPWRRNAAHPIKSQKWGYYATEQEDFTFARMASGLETKTAEAELMDWADDIAYSVHDLEDFHRCRLIPWREVLSAEGREKLLAGIAQAKGGKLTRADQNRIRAAHRRLKKLVDGTVERSDSPTRSSSRIGQRIASRSDCSLSSLRRRDNQCALYRLSIERAGHSHTARWRVASNNCRSVAISAATGKPEADRKRGSGMSLLCWPVRPETPPSPTSQNRC
jgi:predicted deoxyguanosinetriphosphate triphosphohydrolase